MFSTEKTLTILAFEGQNLFFATPLTLQVTFSTRQLETKLSSQPLLLNVIGAAKSASAHGRQNSYLVGVVQLRLQTLHS
jgi:hypothetical protein